MGLNSGTFDRRIQAQRATINIGAGGVVSESWSDIGGPIFARRRDVSDAERIVGGAWVSKLVSRFVVRSSIFTRSIGQSDRLIHEQKIYEIDGIKEFGSRTSFIEITACTEKPS
jgi:head-tail adaptor